MPNVHPCVGVVDTWHQNIDLHFEVISLFDAMCLPLHMGGPVFFKGTHQILGVRGLVVCLRGVMAYTVGQQFRGSITFVMPPCVMPHEARHKGMGSIHFWDVPSPPKVNGFHSLVSCFTGRRTGYQPQFMTIGWISTF